MRRIVEANCWGLEYLKGRMIYSMTVVKQVNAPYDIETAKSKNR